MDEQGARDVLLVRAIEPADHEHLVLSDADRLYASRSAHELAQWEVADQRTTLTSELFLKKRAEQILKKISERIPAFAAISARRDWAASAGLFLPALALLAGALTDRIADPHRVDLLAAPLLAILAWNVFAYAFLLVGSARRALRRKPAGNWFLTLLRPPFRAPRKFPNALVMALANFTEEWARLSAPLTMARVKRIAHLSAGLFAVGAIASLYLRGMLSQYRAGWESTFLDASQVHAVLSALFWPARLVFRLPALELAQIEALHFAQGAGPAGSGAAWVHLYAATLALIVVLPRLGLFLWARWRERRLAARLPLDLQQPYFRKLTEKIAPARPAVLRVLPYSFTLDELRDRNLSVLAHSLLGEQARVMLRPSAGYGDEPDLDPPRATLGQDEVGLTVALFNLSATPEKENHGAFLDHLLRGGARGIAALVDESAYLERIGGEAGGDARVRERAALWRQFCDLHGVPVSVVNLLRPEAHAAAIERELAPALRTP